MGAQATVRGGKTPLDPRSEGTDFNLSIMPSKALLPLHC